MISEQVFKEGMASLSKEMKDMKVSMEKMINEMYIEIAEMRVEMNEQRRSIQFMSDNFDLLKAENKSMSERLSVLERKDRVAKEKMEEEVKERKILEEKLFSVVTPLEIELRKNNLEICGLKEEEGERVVEKVKEIVGKVVPGKTGVVKAYRIGKKEASRRRTVVVQFENRGYRNAALENRKNLRKLEGAEGKLFLNENLPLSVKILLGKANEIRKKKEYRYLWTKDGVIYVRKADGLNVIVVRKMEDINKIV